MAQSAERGRFVLLEFPPLIPKRIGITAQTARSMANWVLEAAEKVGSHD
jgi:hypothetical protein